MGEVLNKMTSGMTGGDPAHGGRPNPETTPASSQGAQPAAQPLTQPAAQPAATPTPAPTSAAPSPAPAVEKPKSEQSAEESPEGPQAEPIEAVVAPKTTKENAPTPLSTTQQAHLKYLYDEEVDHGQEQGQEESRPQEKQSQISEEDALLIQQAKDILSDPWTKLVKKVRDEKGDLHQLIKESGLENLDSLTAEEIIERELRSIGTPETEIDAEVAKTLAGKSRIEINAIIDPLKNKLKAEQQQKSSQFFANTNTAAEEKSNFVEINNRTKQTLEGLRDQYVDKEVFGMQIDEKKWNTVKQSILTGNGYAVPVFDKNNKFTGYDLERSIMFALFENYQKTILKNHVELGKLIGFDEFYAPRKRASVENTSSAEVNNIPDIDKAVKGMQENRIKSKNNWNQKSE